MPWLYSPWLLRNCPGEGYEFTKTSPELDLTLAISMSILLHSKLLPARIIVIQRNFVKDLLTAFFVLAAGIAHAQKTDTVAPTGESPTTTLAKSILIRGQASSYVQELSDKFGTRLSGSQVYEQAAEWAVNKFRTNALPRVYTEVFLMPSGWERDAGSGRILAPLRRPLHLESLGWSPSTPRGGIRGPVTVLTELDSDYISSRVAQIKGHIVLLFAEQDFGEHWTSFARRQFASYSALKNAGALAILQPDVEYNDSLNADAATWDGDLSPLPCAQIGMEDAKLIKRLGEKSVVEVEYEYHNHVWGPVEVRNVIAELPGRTRPDEWIVLGAHLDSWDYATGSQDNGTGVAMVLAAARALQALPVRPDRSIRFVLWGGEEQGFLGSSAWIRLHRSELGQVVAYLNADNGAGHPQGWRVEGRRDVEKAMEPIRGLLSDLDGDGLSREVTFDSDHGPFMLEGVPVLDLWVETTSYLRVHHKAGDTFDKVDILNLNAGSAILAVTAYALADSPDSIAKQLDHVAVGEIVKGANIDLQLLKMLGWSF